MLLFNLTGETLMRAMSQNVLFNNLQVFLVGEIVPGISALLVYLN